MRARGFTLVEVMVALAIVAIALPAVLMALYQQIDDTAYLRDKEIAHMVAANKLAEMRLVIASTRVLTAGKDNGSATMADRDWHWWVETKAEGVVPQFYRVEILVAPEKSQGEAMREKPPKQPLYTLVTFMSGDLQVDTEGPSDPNDPNDPNNPNDGTPVPEEDATPQQDANETPSETTVPELPQETPEIPQDIPTDGS